MTVSKIFTELGLINDNTEVWIRDNDLHVLAHGNWYCVMCTKCQVKKGVNDNGRSLCKSDYQGKKDH